MPVDVEATTDISEVLVTETTTAAALVEVQTSTVSEVVLSDSLTVYSGSIRPEALSVARDLLTGCRYDYYFSDLDYNSYFLIVAKGGFDYDTLQGSDCLCYELSFLSSQSDDYSSVLIRSEHFDAVQVNNALGLLSYSAAPDSPKLIEGGENYALTQIIILCVFGCAWLVDRIFSHIGNKG